MMRKLRETREMKIWGRLFVRLLWMVALVSPISAQTHAAVRVTVTLRDGTPAPGASVRVLNAGFAGTADAAGSLTFDAVPSGRYEIEAALAGYAPATVRIRVSSDAIDVELRLGPPVIAEHVDVLGQAGDGQTTVLKTPEPIAEVPYSVSIVPAARMELQKAQSLNEALRYTAGVQSEQYGGLDQAYDFLTIRGFSGTNNALFRDGTSLFTFGFNGFRIEPYGADSIEVLRGAASVLYGQASPGGIVNVTSKRPTATPLHDVSFEGGNYDHFEGKFDFSGPVSASTPSLHYRLTGLVRDSKTQVDFQPNDRVFVAPSISWHGAHSSLTVLTQYQRDLTGHFQFLPQVGTLEPTAFGFIPNTRTDGEPDFNHVKRYQYSVGYLYERQFSNGWSIRQDTRYDYVNVDFANVYGTTLDPADPTERTLLRGTFTSVGDTAVATVGAQAQRSTAFDWAKNTFIAGGEFQQSSIDQVLGAGDAPALDVYAPVYGAAVTRPDPFSNTLTLRHQTGVYVSDRLRFDNGLAISASGRENIVDDEIHDRLATTLTNENTNKFVWQGGVAFVGHGGWTPHVSYSESFLPVSGTDVQGRRFVPETGQQYEAGLRYQLRSFGSVTATVFDLRRQNALTPDPANPNGQVQTGEVRSTGVELETDVALRAGLSLTASYTDQNIRVTKSNAGDVGLRPAATPTHMASTWLYERMASGRARGVGLGLGIRFQGETFDSTNTVDVPGATLVDAMGSYSIRGLRFAINAQNLFNKTFVGGCDGGTCYYGRARTLYATTSFGW